MKNAPRPFPLNRIEMYIAVDFQNQSMLDAEEIDDVAVNYVLTPELESSRRRSRRISHARASDAVGHFLKVLARSRFRG